MIDVVAQGGASGSPVFMPDTARVIGMLYEGGDLVITSSQQHPSDEANTPHKHTVEVPTNISYAVPSRLILSLMNTSAAQAWKLPSDAEHFDVLIERQRQRMRKAPGYE